MQFPAIIVLLLSFIASTAAQKDCTFGDISGLVYENAPNDTLVTNVTVTGTVGSTITLELTQGLEEYFKLDRKRILVKDSSKLDRNNDLPVAEALNAAILTGNVKCTDLIKGGDNEPQAFISMKYINKELPSISSDLTVSQSEFTPVNTAVTTISADDGDNTGYKVTYALEDQQPSDYFSIDSNTGELKLVKELDYEQDQSINVTVKVSDTGFDETGSELIKSFQTTLTINVEDYDDTPPIFRPCDSTTCVPPLYAANVTLEMTGTLNDIEPQAIEAVDGDSAINATIKYSFVGGSPGYQTYFEIDVNSGEVTVKANIQQESVFFIAIQATEVGNPSKFSIAYLQVDAFEPDDSKPVISAAPGSGNLSNAVVIDDGSEQIYVQDESGNRIKLQVSDADSTDDTILYTNDNPETFQITTDGYIFVYGAQLSTTTRAILSCTITAINIDASTNSPNRISEAVVLEVVVIEMTTQATTEATTFPETSEATSIPVTTTQEVTEPTTLDTTTSIETTMMSSTDSTSIFGTTTVFESTTVQPTTDDTTSLSTGDTTITSASLPTTSPEITTTASDTTIASTADETTSPETTTYSFTDDTTSQPATTDITSITTIISTTDLITTQPTSIATLDSTVQTYTSQTNDQSSVATSPATTSMSTEQTAPETTTSELDVTTLTEMTSTNSETSMSTEQTAPETTTSELDVTTLTEMTSTDSDTFSTGTSDASVVSTSESTAFSTGTSDASVVSTSESTVSIVTSNPSSTSSNEPSTPSVSVDTTTTESLSSSTTLTSMVSTITSPSENTETTTQVEISTPRSITESPDTYTTKGVVIDDVVPKSTLIGVAAGLSSALFIAILVIAYLLWKLMKKDKKSSEDDNRSQTSSQIHANPTYSEEDETSVKEPNGDVDVEAFGFTSGAAINDMDESGVDMENEPDIGSRDLMEFGDEYAAATNPDVRGEDPEYGDETDDDDLQNPATEFERELFNKANSIAASAAAAAVIAKAVEETTVPEVAAEFTPNLPPEIVKEEEVIKEDVYHSVKIVSLQGFGEDEANVKAILKTIDTDMATTEDVNRMRKQISIMEQLSEMDHPNILRCYGSFVTDNTINYASKYAVNGNLKDMLQSGSLSSNDMMLIMANIAKGLQYLHAKNITHGNIWAKAVMLDGMNTPMLTDIEGSRQTSSEYKEIMRWQAVEVVNQTSGSTPTTDVWSFGTLMWEIVSQGDTPYKDVPLQELSTAMEKGQLKKPKGCSDSLYSVMEKCWKKDPRLRDDMYVINSNLSELLLEDSNEHIRMNNSRNDESYDPNDHSDTESNADYTAF